MVAGFSGQRIRKQMEQITQLMVAGLLAGKLAQSHNVGKGFEKALTAPQV